MSVCVCMINLDDKSRNLYGRVPAQRARHVTHIRRHGTRRSPQPQAEALPHGALSPSDAEARRPSILHCVKRQRVRTCALPVKSYRSWCAPGMSSVCAHGRDRKPRGAAHSASSSSAMVDGAASDLVDLFVLFVFVVMCETVDAEPPSASSCVSTSLRDFASSPRSCFSASCYGHTNQAERQRCQSASWCCVYLWVLSCQNYRQNRSRLGAGPRMRHAPSAEAAPWMQESAEGRTNPQPCPLSSRGVQTRAIRVQRRRHPGRVAVPSPFWKSPRACASHAAPCFHTW